MALRINLDFPNDFMLKFDGNFPLHTGECNDMRIALNDVAAVFKLKIFGEKKTEGASLVTNHRSHCQNLSNHRRS